MPTIELEFDAAAHSVDAVQRAGYRFIDRFATDVRVQGGVLRCILHFAGTADPPSEEDLVSFRAEVLDQVLRERIRGETAGVRNVILSLAFSKTGLIEP
jgi:His-Xaa-Ser system protein HxsD